MTVKNGLFKTIGLFVGILVILACATVTGPADGGQSDPSAMGTGIALGIMSTNVAYQQMTLQALQVQMTAQPAYVPPAYVPPTPNIQPLPPTAQIIQPPPAPVVNTIAPPPQELVLEILKSVDTFYCYQSPYQLTITVRVSDINRGMAVYYHIRDKYSGTTSDGQVIDLHRKTSDTRNATIVGGGGGNQNLQFPPLMSESYFVYQIISDDGSYRSPTFSDITFYPCAQ